MAKKPTKTARKAPKLDVQSGQEGADPVAEKKAAVAEQFAEADAKADPAADEAEAQLVGIQVRGY